MLSPEQRVLRSLIGVTTRYRPDDTETIEGARRDLRVSKAEDCLRELLTMTPAPTATQRARLVRLLRKGVTS